MKCLQAVIHRLCRTRLQVLVAAQGMIDLTEQRCESANHGEIVSSNRTIVKMDSGQLGSMCRVPKKHHFGDGVVEAKEQKRYHLANQKRFLRP